MAYHTLRQEYMLMPPVTRAYTTVCLLTTIAVVKLFTIQKQFDKQLRYHSIFKATGYCLTISTLLQSTAHHTKV